MAMYYVSSKMFNELDSFISRLTIWNTDAHYGEFKPREVLGKTLRTADDVDDLLCEALGLWARTWSKRRANGTDYARIKAIVAWRVNDKYLALLNARKPKSVVATCSKGL